MTKLEVGASSVDAFSAHGSSENRKDFTCLLGVGPIPPGNYYIVDRQSGGLLGPIRDLFNDRKQWFALSAADEKIDDETFCNEVKRGCFRLHPKGPLGISEGCITVERASDFQYLQTVLKGQRQFNAPGTAYKAYGRVVVR